MAEAPDDKSAEETQFCKTCKTTKEIKEFGLNSRTSKPYAQCDGCRAKRRVDKSKKVEKNTSGLYLCNMCSKHLPASSFGGGLRGAPCKDCVKKNDALPSIPTKNALKKAALTKKQEELFKDGQKYCTGCNTVKSLSKDFDKHTSKCKACRSQENKLSRAKAAFEKAEKKHLDRIEKLKEIQDKAPKEHVAMDTKARIAHQKKLYAESTPRRMCTTCFMVKGLEDFSKVAKGTITSIPYQSICKPCIYAKDKIKKALGTMEKVKERYKALAGQDPSISDDSDDA